MAIVISGNGIDMGNNPVSNASQIEVQQQQVTPYNGFKNFIINGRFDVWQRGTSFPIGGSNIYTADRWNGYTNNYSHTRVNSDVDSFTYALQVIPKSGVAAQVIQPIELPAIGKAGIFYVGNTITISAYIKASANVDIKLNALFRNSAFDATNQTNIYSVQPKLIPITTTTQRVSWTIPIENSPQATATCLWIGFIANSPDISLTITGVQLEEGSVATPFEQRPFSLELGLCQRYYEKSYSLNTNPGTITFLDAIVGDTSGTGSSTCEFKIEKRVIPTITFYSALTGAAGVICYKNTMGSTPQGDISVLGSWVGTKRMAVESNSGDQHMLIIHFTANAEL